jgi:sugar-specific transcriptional regulator TrmB
MDINQIMHVLEELDLSDKEAEVFIALLKTEGIQPASVIAKKASLNRVTVYKTLINLAQKGVVTKTMQHGIAAFFIEDPARRLEDLLEKKRNKVDRLNDRVLSVLPEIKNLEKHELTAPKMRVYEGYAGVIRAYEDTVMEQNTIRSFENIEMMAPQIKTYMEEVFVPKRMEMGNFAYVLAPENQMNKAARKLDKKLLREARFAPMQFETGLNIYGEKKISFFSYDPDDMFGVILESKAFATTLREIFDFCWKHAK